MSGFGKPGVVTRGQPRAVRRKLPVCATAGLIGIFALFGMALRNPAQALTVNPGDSLEVAFSFSAAPAIPGHAVDFFALIANPITSSGPGILLSAQLFDGDVLLGEGTRPISALIPFSAPGGLYNGFTANLAPVAAGSIDGRVVLTPIFPGDTGFIEINPAVIVGRAGHGVSATTVQFAAPFPTIGQVRVLDPLPPQPAPLIAHTPLPAAWLLLLTALGGLGAMETARRISRRGSPSSSA